MKRQNNTTLSAKICAVILLSSMVLSACADTQMTQEQKIPADTQTAQEQKIPAALRWEGIILLPRSAKR